MTAASIKYQPGDRVVRTAWPSGKPGTVQKVSRATCTVTWDNEDKLERVYFDAIRAETAQDVAKRAYERSKRAWENSRPSTSFAIVERDHRYGHNDPVAARAHANTPDEMRTAARELVELAAWFEQRPKDITP